MINVLNLKLQSVKTTEISLINRRQLDNDKMKFTIARGHRRDSEHSNSYIGECSAELMIANEENIPKDDRSFYVKVSLCGNFLCTSPEEEVTDERLRTSIALELLPHVRSCLASTMTNAGLTPYIIPNSFIPELS